MNIAIVRQRYNPYGGAERFVERALGALVQEGAEVTLITRSWDGAPAAGFAQITCDPPYSRLWGGRAARDASFARCAQQAMAEGGFDITQSHERIPGCRIFRAGDGVHAAWLEHRARARGGLTRWLDRLSGFHRYILAQERAMLTHPALARVICNSRLVAEEMQRYYGVPEEKLVLIENGVDLEHFHPRLAAAHRVELRGRLGIAAEAPLFLYVGGGFERKGVPRLLRAFAAMASQEAHLLVVGGDRSLKAMSRLADSLGIGERVVFTGPQKDVRPYYGAADAFVLPTLYDPMPNAALEALACGLPTITSSSCGIAARIRAGENGYVGDALDLPLLTRHLEALAAPGRAAAMRDAARASVEDLSLSAMAERLVALYRSLA